MKDQWLYLIDPEGPSSRLQPPPLPKHIFYFPIPINSEAIAYRDEATETGTEKEHQEKEVRPTTNSYTSVFWRKADLP